MKSKKSKIAKDVICMRLIIFLGIMQIIFVTFKIRPLIDIKVNIAEDFLNYGNHSKERIVKLPQRVFTPYKYHFPCYKGKAYDPDTKHLNGLIYVKIPKTASSTAAGINLRISVRHARKHLPKGNTKCASTFLHHTSTELQVTKRNKRRTFLWTYIRDTKSIIISSFFFRRRFRKNNRTLTFPDFKRCAENPVQNGKQLSFLATDKAFDFQILMQNKDVWNAVIQEILDEYDFIGLVERFDESLVALRFLLGLDAGDILYIPAKLSGTYDSNGKCNKIPEKINWPQLKDYYNSSTWKRNHALMDQIYAAVNKSLDLTIDNIGRVKFEKAFAEHKHLLKLASDICGPRAIFPCSKDGVSQLKESAKSCYYKDHGCGYACLDELYRNYTRKKL